MIVSNRRNGKEDSMIARTIVLVVFSLAILAGGPGPAAAFPPGGEAATWWYEGIWKLSITENCYKHTDGRPLGKQKEDFYMLLVWAGDRYEANLFWDQALEIPTGYAEFFFSFPSPDAETYLLDGPGWRVVVGRFPDISGFVTGTVNFYFMGALKTAVTKFEATMELDRVTKLRKQSAISGWNQANFVPDSGEYPFLLCNSAWTAAWVAPLPE